MLPDPPAILAESTVIKRKAGDLLFQAGDSCENFLFVLSGTVRVDLIAISGRAILLYRIGPGQACVMTTSCLMSGRDYCAEAIVESDCVACVLTAAQFQTKLAQSPDFRALVFDVFADRLGAMMGRVDDVAFGSIDRRLARCILERSARGADLAITHEQLAVDVGSSREVVSRKLAKWSENGIIRKAHRAIEICDLPAIRKMAE